jgi:hypothetical protein
MTTYRVTLEVLQTIEADDADDAGAKADELRLRILDAADFLADNGVVVIASVDAA